MKKSTLILFSVKYLITAFLLCGLGHNLFADEHGKQDKIEAPYLRAQGENKEMIQLPLLKTDVVVDVSGVIADVKITQVFANDKDYPLDATYVFPGSTKSAVYRMKMYIEDRVIEAKITKKQEAKEKFEQAKVQGKGAALLEQHRPNVFEMQVANIPLKSNIKVEFSYTELLVPEKGIYEYVFPTVVGPRYASELKKGQEPWIKNPFANTGQGADTSIKNKYNTGHGFDIKVKVNSGIPLNQLKSTSHEVEIDFISPSNAMVALKNETHVVEPNDFVLQYQLKGEEIQTGLILYEGDDEENFFLYLAQPPKRIKVDEIPPREYIFIVDVSGSMHGFPLDYSKSLLSDLIGKLRPKDKFNVMLFAGGSSLMSEASVGATEQNIDRAISFIDDQNGGGSTQLLPALKKALKLPGIDDVSRTVVIATDGYVAVEKEAFDLIRDNLGKANFFSFGIGPGVNRFLIEGMAHAGNGEPFVVANKRDAKQKAARFAEYVRTPLLTNVKVKFNGFKAYDVEPSNYQDLFAEKPVVIFGKWKGEKKGTITLEGKNGMGQYQSTIEVKDYEAASHNEALKYLWARKKIQLLSDYNGLGTSKKLEQQITQLGLDYHLLTEFTSFLGIDSKVQDVAQKPIIGQNPGAVPEPHEWVLIIMLTLMGFYIMYKRFFNPEMIH